MFNKDSEMIFTKILYEIQSFNMTFELKLLKITYNVEYDRSNNYYLTQNENCIIKNSML